MIQSGMHLQAIVGIDANVANKSKKTTVTKGEIYIHMYTKIGCTMIPFEINTHMGNTN